MPTTTDGLELKFVKSASITVVPNKLTPKQSFNLQIGVKNIGRKHEESDISIKVNTLDTDISKMHLQLSCERDKLGSFICTIQDLRSRNGTFLNGHRIDDNIIYLTDGDRIKIGNTELLYIPTYLEIE